MGEKIEIIIDDNIPCLENLRGPCFSRTHGSELWVILMEKAYAKLFKSYANIEAGICKECLINLTGVPTKSLAIDDDKLWSNIINGERKNYIMTCGINLLNKEGSESGLKELHAYSLLAGYEISFKGQIIKLVKLRNPWGDGEWNGKWSDKCENWNEISPEVKSSLAYERKPNDGIFFMDFDDFQKYFLSCQFCHYTDNYVLNSKNSTSKVDEFKFFKIDIQKKGIYFFTIHQNSSNFRKDLSQRKNMIYPMITIYLAKKLNKDDYEYIEVVELPYRDVYTNYELEKEYSSGEYLLAVKIKWDNSEINNFTLSSYGPEPVKIQETQENISNFQNKIYLNHAQYICTKKNCIEKFEKPLEDIFAKADFADDCYGYLAAWNKSSKSVNVKYIIQDITEGICFFFSLTYN